VAKPGQQAAERQGPLTLEELAEKTGGLHFHVRDANEGADAAEKIGRALRNEYVIGYRAPRSDSSGKWHRVRVKSNVPKIHVYARSGYYSQ
jgi:VWFA-related protein